MNGIGHTQNLTNAGSSIQVGMLCKKGSGDLELLIEAGLAVIDGKYIERKPVDVATALTVPTATGTYYVYVNHPDAKNSAGTDLADFSVNTVVLASEGPATRTNINGSVDTKLGRSLLLATVTVAANAITGVDNTARLKAFAAPPTLGIHK